MSPPSVPIAIAAVHAGNFDVLKQMLDEDLKKKDEKGRTAVHAACCLGYSDILKYLINERGCSPHEADNHGRTPAFYACSQKWDDDDTVPPGDN